MANPLLAAFARDDRPDADLLAATDAEAFAELVRRYGPLVRGVCRRTVSDRHLADDAFQATFLILARKAARVRGDAVAAFLYSTATFTALRARTAEQRRRRREMPTHPLPEVGCDPSAVDRDALAALSDEVARLPAKLRSAVLACELDDTPRAVAAARLGIPEGTLSSRLAAARKTLADRLRGRGVTAPITALAVAGVPPAAASPTATALAEEIMRTMKLTALKPLAVVAALVVAVTGLAGLSAPPPAKPAAAPPLNRILLMKGAEMSLIDPDGTADPKPLGRAMFYAGLSPRGDQLFVQELAPDAELVREGLPKTRCLVRRVDGSGPPILLPKMNPAAPESSEVVRWSADGQSLLVRQVLSPRGPDGHAEKLSHWQYDPATGAKTEIPLPPGHSAVDWTADGQRLLTAVVTTPPAGGREYRMAVVSRATGQAEPFGPEERAVYPLRFSPDGTRVLYTVQNATSPPNVYVQTLATRAEVRLTEPGGFWFPLLSGAWSPDGRRVVYVRKRLYDRTSANVQVVACDADGSNPKVLAARTLMGDPQVHTNGYTVLDWR